MSEPEVVRRVVCAAIRNDDGKLIWGARHYSEGMVDQIRVRLDGATFYRRQGTDQGFVDQFGVYMTRKEAYIVAKAANQIIYPAACTETELFSEGLY